MENKWKTLIFAANGAIESPMSFDELKKALKTWTVKWFFNTQNEKTGRHDKYLCDVEFVDKISHIVDLEWECVYDSEAELAKLEEAEAKKNEEEEKSQEEVVD